MLTTENLVIDHPLRATLFDRATTGVLFTVDEISEPSLECTGEKADVLSALGVKIASFDRSKTAKFSGSNAIINLGLLAAQLGSDKETASADSKKTAPIFEELTVGGTTDAPAAKITLSQTPASEIRYIYKVGRERGIGETYERGEDAAKNFSVSGKDITLPTGAGLKADDSIYVWYDYETENAVAIANTTEAFSKSGKLVLEVLFKDMASDQYYHGFVVFPKAQMDNNVTLTLNNEAKHGFSIEAVVDYCSKDKKLFDIIVVNEDVA